MAESLDQNLLLPKPGDGQKPAQTLAEWEIQWQEIAQLDLQTQVEQLKQVEAELSAKLLEAGN